jgi:hypothetical protein
MRHAAVLALVLWLGAFGCGNTDPPSPGGTTVAQVESPTPKILPHPFTAEEIRQEWVPGLVIFMRRTSPDGVFSERWTVLDADEEGVNIEYVDTDGSFDPTGEPSTNRSTWIELRGHASFPEAHSTREWVSRSTALGELDGWLYQVADPAAVTVEEFFFAQSVPGAPVQMKISEGGTTIFQLEQVMRMRPVSD